MLRVEDRTGRPPLFSKIEKVTPDIRYDVAPSVQLIARDSFVAETANKMEQLQASVRLISRDLSQLAGKVAQLQEAAAQEHRWQAFEVTEKRSRLTKIEDTLRCCRDLKARIDKIEGRASGDYHAYNSFEAVSRKLAELETIRDDAKRMERTLTLKAWVLSAAVGASALVIVLANALAH